MSNKNTLGPKTLGNTLFPLVKGGGQMTFHKEKEGDKGITHNMKPTPPSVTSNVETD